VHNYNVVNFITAGIEISGLYSHMEFPVVG
jgi:hypothetical protein